MEEEALAQLGHRSRHRGKATIAKKNEEEGLLHERTKLTIADAGDGCAEDGRRRTSAAWRKRRRLRKKETAAEEGDSCERRSPSARKQISRSRNETVYFFHAIWTDLGPTRQKSKVALRPNRA
ncbi:hypothetical protein AXF42_Ash010311 [Apostasia shenzhenica]|uniref:Uncharacterized protein n=1 Tax=Apostasia shenzhenica TaxID=1088818 RepID=A0A2I0BDP3_9ASPA|nr:hypothetical protein AXF42_Ash010311 [Apostasia shenzhenica]